MHYNFYVYLERARDTVAEWLRRWTANPMCSARVGSNPIGVVLLLPLIFGPNSQLIFNNLFSSAPQHVEME